MNGHRQILIAFALVEADNACLQVDLPPIWVGRI
jgi:hypothetical protein